MPKNYDLTLLIPMYNKAPYIERMMRSLAEQTYLPRTRIIVCDDGSTDESLAELQRCAELYEVPGEIFVNEDNLGLARTILELYRKIETPFWCVLDPDDYYIHPKRLELALRFLKANPDYSMHACNYLESYPDGNSFLVFDESTPDFSFEGFNDMPSPQTSAMVYRNFWTAEILDELQRLTTGKRFLFTQADAFRNFCAIHFGKLRFENYIGSVWTKGVGIWDRLTEIERNAINLKAYSNLVLFSQKFFQNPETEVTCLKLSVQFYMNALDELYEMLHDFSAIKFQASDYCRSILETDDADISIAIRLLLEQQKFLVDNGVSLN